MIGIPVGSCNLLINKIRPVIFGHFFICEVWLFGHFLFLSYDYPTPSIVYSNRLLLNHHASYIMKTFPTLTTGNIKKILMERSEIRDRERWGYFGFYFFKLNFQRSEIERDEAILVSSQLIVYRSSFLFIFCSAVSTTILK